MKDCEDVFVIADRYKIAQVIENLVSNAVKYSPVGSTITIGCKTNNGHAQISVSDTGIGIDKKDQENCLNVFTGFKMINLRMLPGLVSAFTWSPKYCAFMKVEFSWTAQRMLARSFILICRYPLINL